VRLVVNGPKKTSTVHVEAKTAAGDAVAGALRRAFVAQAAAEAIIKEG
jgi:hypothetical protein